ncbi:hypothetical protein Hesp01_63130 [Herbidospora sp. NBRC 101105]|nr:hypothetical protein Hesp01_63130 [Herbidospora sp. NBRC 101105]
MRRSSSRLPRPADHTTYGTPPYPCDSTRGWIRPPSPNRPGKSVEVLLKRYAKCLDGQAEQINQRIEAVLKA